MRMGCCCWVCDPRPAAAAGACGEAGRAMESTPRTSNQVLRSIRFNDSPAFAAVARGGATRMPLVILPSMRLFPLLLCCTLGALAQEEAPADGGRGAASNEPINATTFSGL